MKRAGLALILCGTLLMLSAEAAALTKTQKNDRLEAKGEKALPTCDFELSWIDPRNTEVIVREVLNATKAVPRIPLVQVNTHADGATHWRAFTTQADNSGRTVKIVFNRKTNRGYVSDTDWRIRHELGHAIEWALCDIGGRGDVAAFKRSRWPTDDDSRQRELFADTAEVWLRNPWPKKPRNRFDELMEKFRHLLSEPLQ